MKLDETTWYRTTAPTVRNGMIVKKREKRLRARMRRMATRRLRSKAGVSSGGHVEGGGVDLGSWEAVGRRDLRQCGLLRGC